MYLNNAKFDLEEYVYKEPEGPVDIPTTTANNFNSNNPMGWSFNKFSNINIVNVNSNSSPELKYDT
jgi:hypothetical protein